MKQVQSNLNVSFFAVCCRFLSSVNLSGFEPDVKKNIINKKGKLKFG